MTTPQVDQARASRESVLAVPATDRAALVVRGADRTSWLNGLVTCDLAKLGPGEAAYGLLVEKKGKIQTDLFVIPSADSFVLAVPRELRDATLATLDHYLIMEDAEITSEDFDVWALHGPRAGDVLAALGAAWAGKLDLVGAGGALVAVPVAEAERVRDRLASEVARADGVVGDLEGWDAVRVEAGLPRFGVEVDASLYPQEASLEKLAVSFSKGCYLGQEVVYMLENRGHVKRKLVPLDVEGDGPLAAGAPVTTAQGDAVGDVKSSVVGPLSGKPVAIAMVKWAQSKPGTALLAGGRPAVVRG